MEGFEHVVKLGLELERYVVSGPMKFAVRRRTRKQSMVEYQRHGYEVDLVGARRDSLVLASVKSYFGSTGVSRNGFRKIAKKQDRKHFNRYRLFNDKAVRTKVIQAAAERFQYQPKHVELRLYVGKFYGTDQELVCQHLATIQAGCGPIRVIGVDELVEGLLKHLESKTYFNDPVISTLKALRAAGRL